MLELSYDESVYLYENILDENLQHCINEFITSVVEEKKDYCSYKLWEMDQKIGGIGGYAMNPNPVINHFPCGIERSLYRPLQYARSDIDFCDIRMHARYIILNCGLHLETVCKLVLRESKFFGKIRYTNTTLGKGVHLMEKLNIIDEEIISALYKFVKLYNLSKHEVNQDLSKQRLFNPIDALTVYFSVRIIGQYLLKLINFQDCDIYFELVLK